MSRYRNHDNDDAFGFFWIMIILLVVVLSSGHPVASTPSSEVTTKPSTQPIQVEP